MKSQILQLKTSRASLFRVSDSDFFGRIINKYLLFRKSGKLPSLIFLKLFVPIGMQNKITNICQQETINKYFSLHFNLYFKVISRTDQTLRKYHIAQKFYTPIEYSGMNLRQETTIFNYSLSDFNNIIPFIKNVLGKGFGISSGAVSKGRLSTLSPEATKEFMSKTTPLSLNDPRAQSRTSLIGESRSESQSKISLFKSLQNAITKSEIPAHNIIGEQRSPNNRSRSIVGSRFYQKITSLYAEGDEKKEFKSLSLENHKVFQGDVTDKYIRTAPEATFSTSKRYIQNIDKSNTDEQGVQSYYAADNPKEDIADIRNIILPLDKDGHCISLIHGHNVFLRNITHKYLPAPDKIIPSNDVYGGQKTSSHISEPAMHKKISSQIIFLNKNNQQNPAHAVRQEKQSTYLKNFMSNTTQKTDMTFKKPTTQYSVHAAKDIEIPKMRDTVSERIYNAEQVHNPKDAARYEINKIADKVYKIIEKRIAIEKEKRGLC